MDIRGDELHRPCGYFLKIPLSAASGVGLPENTLRTISIWLILEFALLEYLLRNSGRSVTRTMILEHVWDIHFDSISNVVDVHINTLRNKLDRDFRPQLIHTIRGVGYILKDKTM